MNIFRLDDDPKVAATMMCDKHVVKMIIEYAQLMSTAHRMLDGEEYEGKTKNGRKIRRWKAWGAAQERLLYKASHINHPSAIWARENSENYRWLYKHFKALCAEYTHRYGRVHMTDAKLTKLLWWAPKNIRITKYESELPQCMPDDCKKDNVVDAYRNYYIQEKKDFAKWTNRETPSWFICS